MSFAMHFDLFMSGCSNSKIGKNQFLLWLKINLYSSCRRKNNLFNKNWIDIQSWNVWLYQEKQNILEIIVRPVLSSKRLKTPSLVTILVKTFWKHIEYFKDWPNLFFYPNRCNASRYCNFCTRFYPSMPVSRKNAWLP